MAGLGRAMGETMAVTMIIGNPRIFSLVSCLAPGKHGSLAMLATIWRIQRHSGVKPFLYCSLDF